jgi:ABC-type branched-subunit amino acid transport system substrate-binding protein
VVLRVGALVSLSGRYAVQGAGVRVGLESWARERGAELVLLDDGSSPAAAARLYGRLATGCRFVVGPYGGDSMRAVAQVCSGSVVWNQGAAADDVQRLPGVVSVPSPASRYLVALAEAVSVMRPDAAVCVLTAPGHFAAWARDGVEAAAPGLGLSLVTDPAMADVVLLCGPLGWELERIRRLRRPELVIGGVSPGIARFPHLLGDDPEGLLAAVQWHPDLPIQPRLGPASVPLPDYLAAQAYATALIADHCLQLAPDDPLTAAKQLQTTTFFGGFQLASDGLQIGHHLAVVYWRNRRQELQPATTA